eukprot:8611842-Ditylum_brightwellii.AAC.1
MSVVIKELIRVEDFASDAAVLCLASIATIKKITSLESADSANQAVTVLSLVFLRLQSFAINSRSADWKERAIYSWSSLFWFTSFHKEASTMLFNKRNMVIEIIGTIFLVTRKDVQTPHPVTSEANEHTFGRWRRVQHEFNLAQVCGVEEKHRNYVDAVFKG